MSAALDNLTAATTKLAASVDAAVSAFSTPPGVPESAVQSAADAVNAQADRLTAAVTPVPTTSAPTA